MPDDHADPLALAVPAHGANGTKGKVMGVLAGSVEDLVLLAEVVEAGGFSVASARCGVESALA